MDNSQNILQNPQKLVPNFMERKRITDLLDEAIKYKAIFITAMPGYGKTLEVYNWLSKCNKKIKIINVNQKDTIKNICEKVGNAYGFDYKSLENIKNNLEKISIEEESILVIDELENMINNKEEIKISAEIVDKITNNVHFIFISKGQLPEEYKILLMTNKLKIINQRDLEFSEEETKKYLEKSGCNLTENQINEVYDYVCCSPVYLNAFIERYKENNKIYSKEVLENAYNDLIIYLDYRFTNEKYQVYKKLLTQISKINTLDSMLIKEIMKVEDGNSVLEKIYNSSNILEKNTRNNEYIITDFFKKYFLKKELNNEEKTELNKALNIVAEKYEKEGKRLKAVEFYTKAEEFEKAIKVLEYIALHEIKTTYDLELVKVIEKIPEKYYYNSIAACWCVFVNSVINYNIEEINKWQRIFKDLVLKLLKEDENIEHYNTAMKAMIFSDILIPKNTPTMILNKLSKILKKDTTLLKYVKDINITENQPTLLCGRKDFSEWTLHPKLLKPMFAKLVNEIPINKFKGFIEILSGEVFYQRNDLNKALTEIGKGILETRKNNNIELEFIGNVLNLKILFANNELEQYERLLKNIKTNLLEVKDKFLLRNLEAGEAKFALIRGDFKTANYWFETKAPDITKNFNVLEKYMYTIKARIYIAHNEYAHALIILKRLEPYFVENERKSNLIENYILQAICFDRLEKKELAIFHIEKAILIAQKYNFIRVFADEGLSANKILTKYKNDNQNNKIKDEFLKEIILESKKFGDSHPLLYAHEEIKELTNNEKKILELINAGLKNNEIAEKMNISMATVKTHINHIFSKLGVENRVQAINTSKKKKII